MMEPCAAASLWTVVRLVILCYSLACFYSIFMFLGYRSWGFFVYVFHDACTDDFLSNPIECLKSGWILAPNFLSIATEFCSFLSPVIFSYLINSH